MFGHHLKERKKYTEGYKLAHKSLRFSGNSCSLGTLSVNRQRRCIFVFECQIKPVPTSRGASAHMLAWPWAPFRFASRHLNGMFSLAAQSLRRRSVFPPKWTDKHKNTLVLTHGPGMGHDAKNKAAFWAAKGAAEWDIWWKCCCLKRRKHLSSGWLFGAAVTRPDHCLTGLRRLWPQCSLHCHSFAETAGENMAKIKAYRRHRCFS